MWYIYNNCRVRSTDLLEIFVDFLFVSLVMLVCIILCNKLFTVNHNIKRIYIYLQERKRREIVLIIEVNTNVVDTFGFLQELYRLQIVKNVNLIASLMISKALCWEILVEFRE